MFNAQLCNALRIWYFDRYFSTASTRWDLVVYVGKFLFATTWILTPSVTCLFVQEYFDAICVFCSHTLPLYLKVPLVGLYFVSTAFPIACYLTVSYYGGCFLYYLDHLRMRKYYHSLDVYNGTMRQMWIIVVTNTLTTVLLIVGVLMLHFKIREIQKRTAHYSPGLKMDYLVVAGHVLVLLVQNVIFAVYYYTSVGGAVWDNFFTAQFILIAILDILVCCIICNIQYQTSCVQLTQKETGQIEVAVI